MAKRESYADQVISLRGEVERLNAALAEAEKKRKSYEDSATYASKQRAEAQAELEDAHDAIDGIDGAPSRTYTKANAYGETPRTIAARLCGYLAKRA